MNRHRFITAVLSILLMSGLAAALQDEGEEEDWKDDDHGFNVAAKKEENIQKTFTLSGTAERSLEVDNVFGAIEVEGAPGDTIQLVATKSIRARSQKDLEQAENEVTLDITQDQNAVRLYVNGPFRCNHNCDCKSRCVSIHDPHYTVKYDFKLKVPQRIKLTLGTVNEGFVKVRGVRGDYDVSNVNGPIDMNEVGGSGRATTVNGRVRVSFVENPKADSVFKTINGNVDLYFAPSLAATFRFKTMQGDVYTDFPMEAAPAQAAKAERRNGRFVYRADRYTAGKVGAGGPEIRMENLNGDLRVLARANGTGTL
jgi:DUF4097 and DUF4098 domain-containing protein YvlB